MISGTGMRPGDIVTASNGKTIEVCFFQHITTGENLCDPCSIAIVDNFPDCLKCSPSRSLDYSSYYGYYCLVF
jgi:hypothetical protein